MTSSKNDLSPSKLDPRQVATSSLKSLMLGMSVVSGKLDVELALRAANLEENFSIEKFGGGFNGDPDHAEKRSNLLQWLRSCQEFSQIVE